MPPARLGRAFIPAKQTLLSSRGDRTKKGRTPRYQINEAHLSTLQARPQAPPRISRAHGNQGRPRRRRRAPQPRPQAAFGLSKVELKDGRRPEAGAPDERRRPNPGRLRKRAQYLAVQRGEKRRGPLFLLEVLGRGDDGPARYGLTVTKKNGNAAMRNRIRRRLREAVRLSAADDMAAGSDYVIVARREALGAPFAELKAELARRIKAGRPRKS